MSEAIQRILERQAKERNQQMDEDLAAVLNTKPGRRLLMTILAKGRVWARIGCPDDLSPLRLGYINGRRDAAAEILEACNRVAASNVALAQTENNERIEQWNEQIKTGEQT